MAELMPSVRRCVNRNIAVAGIGASLLLCNRNLALGRSVDDIPWMRAIGAHQNHRLAPPDIGDERAEILLRWHERELIRPLVLNQAIARCNLLRAKAEEVDVA